MPLGPVELFFILVVVLLLFGARRLPQLGRDLGEGLREFRKTGRELTQAADQPPELRREE